MKLCPLAFYPAELFRQPPICTIFTLTKKHNTMKKFYCLFIMLALCACSARTQTASTTIRLFPGEAPGETKELTETKEIVKENVGSTTLLSNVSTPEITIYPAPGSGLHPAVVVCPGGGYNILAYDKEGTEVCEWLNGNGITAVLLKYRVPRREGRPKHEAPLQDAQRALSYVRAHAAQLDIKSNQIGIMGFSAGAHLSVMASTSFATRTYPAIDEADQASCRPDFCLLVYPAYLDGENFQLAPEIKVTADVPPTMIVQAEDDHSYINSALFYYHALKNAKVPAWMHLYSKGGHGFGLRESKFRVSEWPQRAEDWFHELGIIQ